MADHRRFLVAPEQICAEEALIEGDTARQICKVLRLKEGDPITLLNGSGGVFEAVIAAVSPRAIKARIINTQHGVNEPTLRLVLASCLPKSDRIEHIVQKCTELGISEMIMVSSERTVVRLDDSGQAKRLERLNKIAIEAAEQCGRSVVPKLSGVIEFDELIKSAPDYDLALVGWEEEAAISLRDTLRENRNARSALLIIGPEGGFTQSEVQSAIDAGVKSVSFGGRILRTDTAAVAGCAAIMYELEGQL